MKAKFKKKTDHWFYGRNGEFYVNEYVGYFRNVRTKQEKTQNFCHKKDLYNDRYRVKIRGKRSYSMIPDSYDDVNCARYCGRSWKDFTKKRKQWM